MTPRKRRVKAILNNKQEEILYLHKRMIAGKATGRELVRLSLLKDMITTDQYADFLEIEKNCEEN